MKTTHERGVEMLKSFGLSQNEALIYTYLLERGIEMGTTKIAQGIGLHRQYVYISMSRLMELGLVEPIPYGKQSKYKAAPPTHIEKIARRKAVEAEDIVRELNTFSSLGNEQDFEIIQSKEAIQRYEMDYVERAEEGSEEYILGGNSKGFEHTMEDLLDEYTNIKDKKRMKVYYIGSGSLETERYKTQTSFIYRVLAKLPQRVTHMSVRQDKVLFYSFLNPPLLYVLRSDEVAEDYKSFFLMLWEIASPQ